MYGLSRRDFAWTCTGLVAEGLTPRGFAQSEDSQDALVQLAHEFPQAVLLAVSPDSKKVCIGTWAFETFTLRMDRWFRGRNSWTLEVFELGDWTSIYSSQFPERVLLASFFSDVQKLYAQTMWFMAQGQFVLQQAIMDLLTGKRIARQQPVDKRRAILFYAVGKGLLVGGAYDGTMHQTSKLLQVELPAYRELMRVPYLPRDNEPKGIRSNTFYSADRSTMVYRYGRLLICRRTRDLSVSWTREIERDLERQWRLGGVRRWELRCRRSRRQQLVPSYPARLLRCDHGQRWYGANAVADPRH